MGCVSKRRGKWVVDWREHGQRRWKTFATKRDAEDFLTEVRRKAATATVPIDVDPRITVRDFVPLFLERCRAHGIRQRTLTRYEASLAHVVATLGDIQVRELSRPRIEAFLGTKILDAGSCQGRRALDVSQRKLQRSSVGLVLSVLSNLMSAAVARQLVAVNPLAGLARQMRLGRRRGGEKVKALAADQVASFLAAADRVCPDVSWAFTVMVAAGLRVGETMALAWDRHVDLEAAVFHVEEQVDGALKDSDPRDVPMAPGVLAVCRALRTRHREDALAAGRDVHDHLFRVFDTDRSTQAQQRVMKRLQRAFARTVKAAALPAHHTMHSLRHSFASIQLSRGVPIAAVKQWLGHSSITLTVDLYGSWLPTEAKMVDLVVAEGGPDGSRLEEEANARH